MPRYRVNEVIEDDDGGLSSLLEALALITDGSGREQWDDWFKELAYKIVDMKVSIVTSTPICAGVRRADMVRTWVGCLETPSMLLSRVSHVSRTSCTLSDLPHGMYSHRIACAAILALEKVPHWDHPDDISLIRSTLRLNQDWDDVSFRSNDPVTSG